MTTPLTEPSVDAEFRDDGQVEVTLTNYPHLFKVDASGRSLWKVLSPYDDKPFELNLTPTHTSDPSKIKSTHPFGTDSQLATPLSELRIKLTGPEYPWGSSGAVLFTFDRSRGRTFFLSQVEAVEDGIASLVGTNIREPKTISKTVLTFKSTENSPRKNGFQHSNAIFRGPISATNTLVFGGNFEGNTVINFS